MAGSPTEIPLTLRAELGQLRADLAKVPGITADEAKLMVGELNKSFKAAEAAAKKAAASTAKGWDGAKKSTKEAADAARDLEDRFGGAGSSAAKLAGALGIASPAAGEMARNIADIADVGEVATAALGATKGGVTALLGTLGPVAIAIGVVTAAFALYTSSCAKAEEAQKKAEETAKTSKEAYEKLTLAVRDSRIEQDRLAGRITDVDAKVKTAANSLKDEYGPAVQAAKAALDEARAAQAAWAKGIGSAAEASEADKMRLEELTAATGEAAVAYSKVQQQYKAQKRLAESNIKTTAALAEGKKKEAEATKAAGETVKVAKAAVKDYTAAYAALTAAMDEDTTATRSVADAIERLQTAAAAADASRLTGAAALRAARDTELAQLEQQYQAAMALAMADGSERTALNEAYEAARVAVSAKADATIEANHKASLKATEAALTESLARQTAEQQSRANAAWDIAEKSVAAAAEIWGVYTDARIKEGEALAAALANTELNLSAEMRAETQARLDDQRAKAMLAFRVGQGLALAQATMAAWKAAAEAFAATAAIPGIGLAAAPAAAALTFAAIEGGAVAQIAAQEPPSFASGGVAAFSGGSAGGADHMSVSPRELMGILTPRGVDAEGGPRGVAARNRGQASAPAVVAVSVHGSRIEDRTLRRQIAGAGAIGRAVAVRGKGAHRG